MRLTKKMADNGRCYLSGLAEVSNYYPKGYGRIQVGHAVEKLAEYEDLEEQGKLLKPPCKVGDVTYSVRKSSEEIIVAVVERIEIDEGGNWVITSYEDSHRFEDFGKTVFLVKEEAEAAWRALKG